MRSEATTVEEYLAELPAERREVVESVRQLVLKHLPEGFRESMNWGMIAYEIPLERYSDTYNGQPLGVVALAAQKNHYALYLHGVYMSPELTRRLENGYSAAGKKLDMGKSCVRFKRLEQIEPEVLGEIIGAVSPEAFIEMHEAVHAGRKKRRKD
jgi:uncharacterized protein YdhG (YjbR/CyaY superfamily)